MVGLVGILSDGNATQATCSKGGFQQMADSDCRGRAVTFGAKSQCPFMVILVMVLEDIGVHNFIKK